MGAADDNSTQLRWLVRRRGQQSSCVGGRRAAPRRGASRTVGALWGLQCGAVEGREGAGAALAWHSLSLSVDSDWKDTFRRWRLGARGWDWEGACSRARSTALAPVSACRSWRVVQQVAAGSAGRCAASRQRHPLGAAAWVGAGVAPACWPPRGASARPPPSAARRVPSWLPASSAGREGGVGGGEGGGGAACFVSTGRREAVASQAGAASVARRAKQGMPSRARARARAQG